MGIFATLKRLIRFNQMLGLCSFSQREIPSAQNQLICASRVSRVMGLLKNMQPASKMEKVRVAISGQSQSHYEVQFLSPDRDGDCT